MAGPCGVDLLASSALPPGLGWLEQGTQAALAVLLIGAATAAHRRRLAALHALTTGGRGSRGEGLPLQTVQLG